MALPLMGAKVLTIRDTRLLESFDSDDNSQFENAPTASAAGALSSSP